MKAKKFYLQPTMDVVWLNASATLLAGSNGTGEFSGDGGPEEEEMS